jgi:isoleucyl-tRNA synthetase
MGLLLREIASLGRSARMEAKLKVRQPLSGMTVVLNGEDHLSWLADHCHILPRRVEHQAGRFSGPDSSELVSYLVQPNFKRLGPRVGKRLPQLKEALQRAEGGALLKEMNRHQQVTITIEGEPIDLSAEDIQVRLEARPGWAAAQGPQCVVVLATELNEELIEEGWAQDVKRLVQDYRKQRKLDFQTASGSMSGQRASLYNRPSNAIALFLKQET